MIVLSYVLLEDILHGISFVISKWLISEHGTDKIYMVLLLFHLVWTFILRPFPEIERVLALQCQDWLRSCSRVCLLHRCCRHLIWILWLVGTLWIYSIISALTCMVDLGFESIKLTNQCWFRWLKGTLNSVRMCGAAIFRIAVVIWHLSVSY